MLARAEARRTWRVLVALGLLAGAALGVALAATQVARRTTTAYDRLALASGAPDAVVLTVGSDRARRRGHPAPRRRAFMDDHRRRGPRRGRGGHVPGGVRRIDATTRRPLHPGVRRWRTARSHVTRRSRRVGAPGPTGGLRSRRSPAPVVPHHLGDRAVRHRLRRARRAGATDADRRHRPHRQRRYRERGRSLLHPRIGASPPRDGEQLPDRVRAAARRCRRSSRIPTLRPPARQSHAGRRGRRRVPRIRRAAAPAGAGSGRRHDARPGDRAHRVRSHHRSRRPPRVWARAPAPVHHLRAHARDAARARRSTNAQARRARVAAATAVRRDRDRHDDRDRDRVAARSGPPAASPGRSRIRDGARTRRCWCSAESRSTALLVGVAALAGIDRRSRATRRGPSATVGRLADERSTGAGHARLAVRARTGARTIGPPGTLRARSPQ